MEVSFSDRLHNIMALRNLLGLQEADGHPDARSLEESAYLQAKSKVVRHLLITS